MATDLYAISNIKTNKEEVLANKEIYLEKLKALKLEHITVFGRGKLSGDWDYEFPYTYDDKLDKIIPDKEAKELIFYTSPFEFDIRVYENCLELIIICRYRFLYEDEYRHLKFVQEDLLEFRKNIFDIISIFGGTEIIYLADNSCDKLGTYLELWVWEGKSYNDVKKDIIRNNLPFRNDYLNLKLKDLSYNNITEVIYDDFKDLRKTENQNL